MKKANRINSGSAPTSDDGSIGALNWVALAQSSGRGRDGIGFVIYAPGHPGATPAAWNAWIRYFDDRGIKTKFMRQYKVATVPTMWPEEFDLTAETSDRRWTDHEEKYVGPERRKELADMLRRKVNDGRLPRPPSVRNFSEQADRLAALETLEKRADYWKSPIA